MTHAQAARHLVFFLTVAAAFLGFAPHDAAALDIEQLATYRGGDRTQILLEGARKEGTLTFYSALVIDQAIRPLVAGFETKYPFIKVQFAREDPPQLLQKLMAERRAGRYVADVFESVGLEVAARRADVDRPFWSPELEAYPADQRSAENTWAPTRFNYIGMAYNTNLVPAKEVPQAYEDLLNPKWKGKMVWASTYFGAIMFITGVRKFMGEDKALDYLQKLSKQHVAGLVSSSRAVLNRVIAGEYAMELDALLHHPLLSAKKGAPVAPKPIEPVLTVVGSVMLSKSPPHPHAALLFIDFLLSPSGQEVLRGADYFPAHPKVPPLPELSQVVPKQIGLRENFLSPELIAAESPKSKELFERLFTK